MRYFSIIAAFLITLSAVPAAQADERDEALAALKACQEISVDTVRLACLDAATRLLNRLPVPEDQPLSTLPTPVAPAPPNEVDSLARERANLAAEREQLARQRAELEQRAAEQAGFAGNANSAEIERLAAERAALEKERTELAEAQAIARAQQKKDTAIARANQEANTLRTTRAASVPISVSRITVNKRTRLHTFYTSDGEIIRQYDLSSNFRPPSSLPASATVKRRGLGSRWLSFDQYPNRSIKVSIAEKRDTQ